VKPKEYWGNAMLFTDAPTSEHIKQVLYNIGEMASYYKAWSPEYEKRVFTRYNEGHGKHELMGAYLPRGGEVPEGYQEIQWPTINP
jgi:hypothetical protein